MWKGVLKSKGLNINKAVIIIENTRNFTEVREFHCAVCRKGVGSISTSRFAGVERMEDEWVSSKVKEGNK